LRAAVSSFSRRFEGPSLDEGGVAPLSSLPKKKELTIAALSPHSKGTQHHVSPIIIDLLLSTSKR
jgi:hypothetical protein